jgi:O-succinylbenzoic acid--CoA ligase
MHGALRYWPVPELVALDMPGGTRFVDALRAVWDAGNAAAPLDPRLPDAARRRVLEALAPTRIMRDDGEQHALGRGAGVEAGDALVVATSGTSGRPKGVVLTHDAVAASSRATSHRLGVDPHRHTWLACLPLAHIGGLSVLTRALVTETRLVVTPAFDPRQVESLGRSGGVTHVSLVARALGRLDASVFERILLGGGRPPDAVPSNAVTTYGMTETGSGVVYDGVPLDGVEVALRPIARSDGSTDGGTDGGTDGEILVRGPMLFRGYRDGTDGRVVGPDGTPGWFATGDAGGWDVERRLVVRGRIAEVIATGGEMVWPEAVERVLATHPAVAEVAVWRRADPEWGERVVAWVVPAGESPTLEDLRRMASEAVAPWAAPKELVIVTDLPRTPGGKLRRGALDGADADAEGSP